MLICSQPQCQTTAGCVCQIGMTVMDHAKLVRIAELEAALKKVSEVLTMPDSYAFAISRARAIADQALRNFDNR